MASGARLRPPHRRGVSPSATRRRGDAPAAAAPRAAPWRVEHAGCYGHAGAIQSRALQQVSMPRAPGPGQTRNWQRVSEGLRMKTWSPTKLQISKRLLTRVTRVDRPICSSGAAHGVHRSGPACHSTLAGSLGARRGGNSCAGSRPGHGRTGRHLPSPADHHPALLYVCTPHGELVRCSALWRSSSCPRTRQNVVWGGHERG